ncbi:MAG: methyltransferase domain-containing protein [Melioribacteraceae bacterium]|nr:methyltransferase domain-containing protein [Melioribacteraceae bacterium]
MEKEILIPGSDSQLKLVMEIYSFDNPRILVVGSSSEFAAAKLAEKTDQVVELIVEDYDSLINSKMVLDNNPKVKVRLMDFEVTDFDKDTFDLIYAQCSITNVRKNKIVKHLKKLLKKGGTITVGEIVNLREDKPVFLDDIWESADLDPAFTEDLRKYYEERNFIITEEVDLSSKLYNYYSANIKKLSAAKDLLEENEKSYHKKLLKRVSHESGVYLKQGGDKYIGFKVLIMEKG